jgi:hypothetical protein
MFTPGLEQLVYTLGIARPSARVAFPPAMARGKARRHADETATAWLRRCADELGGIEKIVVEENLALLLVVHVVDDKITYANLQALWAAVPLTQYASGDGTERHAYLRLDHDLSALGPLLKEPQPHVHVEADGGPRFPIAAPPGEVVGWFIDFVYRNFFYDDWIVWAEVAWDDWCRETRRTNRWARLVSAFQQSQTGVIEADTDLREDLAQLKRCLRAERRKLFPYEVDADRATLFCHHAD